jgi:hypothetical protein
MKWRRSFPFASLIVSALRMTPDLGCRGSPFDSLRSLGENPFDSPCPRSGRALVAQGMNRGEKEGGSDLREGRGSLTFAKRKEICLCPTNQGKRASAWETN